MVDYIDNHQDEIVDYTKQAEQIYNTTSDIAIDVANNAVDAFSETATDIYDMFSDEYQKIMDKVNGKTLLTQAEEDEDFSEGEDDEGHPEDEPKFNETEDDFFKDLDHIENDNNDY